MVVSTLALASVVDFATGLLYAFVGVRLGARRVSGSATVAAFSFRTWWFSIAALLGINAVRGGLAAFDLADAGPGLAIAIGMHYATIALLCVALWGLLSYLAFLFTGRERSWVPIAAFYSLYLAYALGYAASHVPMRVDADAWTSAIAYQFAPSPASLIVLFALLLVPQLVGAVAYGALYFRLDSPTQRYRVALVSTSLTAWFGVALVGDVLLVDHTPAWAIANRVIGLVAATAILIAFQPPAFVSRRLARAARRQEVT